jgi:hypothetical protein
LRLIKKSINELGDEEVQVILNKLPGKKALGWEGLSLEPLKRFKAAQVKQCFLHIIDEFWRSP